VLLAENSDLDSAESNECCENEKRDVNAKRSPTTISEVMAVARDVSPASQGFN
tara:strand:+ start:22851 stop:23009 length:159 start_codon:yes stop_codon:yes gene_type:complete